MKGIISLLSNLACGLLFLCCVREVHAQQYFQNMEYGFSAGISQYFGDINPDWGFKEVRPAASINVKKNFNPYISLGAQLSYTKVGYKDSYSDNEFQKNRNLGFTSDIIELAAIGEFNFFWFETGNERRKFTPFIALGVAAFYYEPMASFSGTDYKLRLIGTEGQHTQEYADRKYSNLGIAFPVGAGVKWWIAPGMNMNLQIVNRFTLTDYLDDVSRTYVGAYRFSPNPSNPTVGSILQDPSLVVDGQKMGVEGAKRGDESTKDHYLMLQVGLAFQLRTYKCPKLDNTMWQGSSVNY